MILFDRDQYLAASVSTSEIDGLLNSIEATGFFTISGHGDQYIPNAPTPSFSGGWGSSITVRGHHISIEDAQQDHLAGPILEVLDIIAGFRPSDLGAYQPDRVTVWALPAQDPSLESRMPTPAPPILRWSSEDIHLGQFTEGPHVVSRGTLSFLHMELGEIPAFRKVRQENQDYLVLVCPAFD